MICVSSLVLKSNPTPMVRPRSLKTNKTPDELPQYFRVNETDIRLVCSSFIASYILVLEMSTLARVCQLFFFNPDLLLCKRGGSRCPSLRLVCNAISFGLVNGKDEAALLSYQNNLQLDSSHCFNKGRKLAFVSRANFA